MAGQSIPTLQDATSSTHPRVLVGLLLSLISFQGCTRPTPVQAAQDAVAVAACALQNPSPERLTLCIVSAAADRLKQNGAQLSEATHQQLASAAKECVSTVAHSPQATADQCAEQIARRFLSRPVPRPSDTVLAGSLLGMTSEIPLQPPVVIFSLGEANKVKDILFISSMEAVRVRTIVNPVQVERALIRDGQAGSFESATMPAQAQIDAFDGAATLVSKRLGEQRWLITGPTFREALASRAKKHTEASADAPTLFSVAHQHTLDHVAHEGSFHSCLHEEWIGIGRNLLAHID